MHFHQRIEAIDSHAMGEPARIIVESLGIKGKTVREKKDYIKDHLDNVRTTVIHEPRGHAGTCFNGSIQGEVEVGEFKGVIPQITGGAYITGFSTFLLDDRDPLRNGFRLKI